MLQGLKKNLSRRKASRGDSKAGPDDAGSDMDLLLEEQQQHSTEKQKSWRSLKWKKKSKRKFSKKTVASDAVHDQTNESVDRQGSPSIPYDYSHIEGLETPIVEVPRKQQQSPIILMEHPDDPKIVKSKENVIVPSPSRRPTLPTIIAASAVASPLHYTSPDTPSLITLPHYSPRPPADIQRKKQSVKQELDELRNKALVQSTAKDLEKIESENPSIGLATEDATTFATKQQKLKKELEAKEDESKDLLIKYRAAPAAAVVTVHGAAASSKIESSDEQRNELGGKQKDQRQEDSDSKGVAVIPPSPRPIRLDENYFAEDQQDMDELLSAAMQMPLPSPAGEENSREVSWYGGVDGRGKLPIWWLLNTPHDLLPEELIGERTAELRKLGYADEKTVLSHEDLDRLAIPRPRDAADASVGYGHFGPNNGGDGSEQMEKSNKGIDTAGVNGEAAVLLDISQVTEEEYSDEPAAILAKSTKPRELSLVDDDAQEISAHVGRIPGEPLDLAGNDVKLDRDIDKIALKESKQVGAGAASAQAALGAKIIEEESSSSAKELTAVSRPAVGAAEQDSSTDSAINTGAAEKTIAVAELEGGLGNGMHTTKKGDEHDAQSEPIAANYNTAREGAGEMAASRDEEVTQAVSNNLSRGSLESKANAPIGVPDKLGVGAAVMGGMLVGAATRNSENKDKDRTEVQENTIETNREATVGREVALVAATSDQNESHPNRSKTNVNGSEKSSDELKEFPAKNNRGLGTHESASKIHPSFEEEFLRDDGESDGSDYMELRESPTEGDGLVTHESAGKIHPSFEEEFLGADGGSNGSDYMDLVEDEQQEGEELAQPPTNRVQDGPVNGAIGIEATPGLPQGMDSAKTMVAICVPGSDGTGDGTLLGSVDRDSSAEKGLTEDEDNKDLEVTTSTKPSAVEQGGPEKDGSPTRALFVNTEATGEFSDSMSASPSPGRRVANDDLNEILRGREVDSTSEYYDVNGQRCYGTSIGETTEGDELGHGMEYLPGSQADEAMGLIDDSFDEDLDALLGPDEFEEVKVVRIVSSTPATMPPLTSDSDASTQGTRGTRGSRSSKLPRVPGLYKRYSLKTTSSLPDIRTSSLPDIRTSRSDRKAKVRSYKSSASVLSVNTTSSASTSPRIDELSTPRSVTKKYKSPRKIRAFGSYYVPSKGAPTLDGSPRSPRSNFASSRTFSPKKIPLYARTNSSFEPDKCTNKWVSDLHQKIAGCERCLHQATEAQRKRYEREGHHYRVCLVRGGCSRSCRLFPREPNEKPVRLCRKCFYDTHHLGRV